MNASPVTAGSLTMGALPMEWQEGSDPALFVSTTIAEGSTVAASLRVFRALGSDTRYLLERLGANDEGPLGRPHRQDLPSRLADGISLLSFDETDEGLLSARIVLVRRAWNLDIILSASGIPVEAAPDVYTPMLDLLASVHPNEEDR